MAEASDLINEIPKFVWYNQAPRRVLEKKTSEMSGEEFYVLEKNPDIDTVPILAIECKFCEPLLYEEALLMRDVRELTDEELDKRLELAQTLKMVESDTPKARSNRQTVKAEKKLSKQANDDLLDLLS